MMIGNWQRAYEDERKRREAAEAQLAAAREAIEDYLDGNYLRAPRNGRCQHGIWSTDACANCIDEHFISAFTATALAAAPVREGAFPIGMSVRKTKGSSWRGKVVGHYSTSLTPDGVCVESDHEPGSVQIYPAAALAYAAPGEKT